MVDSETTSTEVEVSRENLETFPHRKKEVQEILLTRAHSGRVIKYGEMYGLFKPGNTCGPEDGLWKMRVWNTVEEVCHGLSTGDGALYYSLLANSSGVPQDVFWQSFLRWRRHEYQSANQCELPARANELDLSQKICIARFERDRVYRHARKYWKKFGQTWERVC